MLIINGTVMTMAGEIFSPGYVLTEGEKIISAGPMDNAPQAGGVETLDAAGLFVLPGFVDAHTHLGMFEDSLGFEGDDGNEDTDPVTPQLRAVDAVNPMDRCFFEAVCAGVTSVMTGPGSANPVGGQFAAVKTAGNRIDAMVIRAPACMKFALGENPKFVYHGKNQTPVTRMATAALIRETLYKAREYLRKKEKAAQDADIDAPDYDIKLEALGPLLRGEIPAHFHAHRADDIFTAIRLGREFGLDFAVVHGTEGHLIGPELASEKISVICGPALGDRSKPELRALTFETPGALSRAGVRCAICTDHPETPIQYLPLCAALAVKSGMDEGDALMAITKNAADIAGIGNRVGSLEPGKDADIVLFDRHPLEFGARTVRVIINGETIYSGGAACGR